MARKIYQFETGVASNLIQEKRAANQSESTNERSEDAMLSSVEIEKPTNRFFVAT
jgi:hypothetical protein